MKLPFLTIRCQYGGFHLPSIYVHCAISARSAKFGVMVLRHLCSIDREVDLPVDLPILAVTVTM